MRGFDKLLFDLRRALNLAKSDHARAIFVEQTLLKVLEELASLEENDPHDD